MLENLIVAVVVAGAFAYAGWALVPRASRQRFARRLVEATGGPEASGTLARLSQSLMRAAAGGSQCHGCDAPDPARDKRTPQ